MFDQLMDWLDGKNGWSQPNAAFCWLARPNDWEVLYFQHCNIALTIARNVISICIEDPFIILTLCNFVLKNHP
jgi:hypothetical protein